MSNALDMSLDDLIKNNKKSGGGNPRGKGRGASGIGPARRAPNRSSNRPAPYTVGKRNNGRTEKESGGINEVRDFAFRVFAVRRCRESRRLREKESGTATIEGEGERRCDGIE
ncbi:hypothetical protein KSP40_PGU012617 [Platanthera guangdongensis]|uniref:Uncharacterized protein n=1 Tax=Platanthera guangdongensis TaxID=2320717 RepID=A0ABR2LTX0_9ASPA